jgi:hypothetical protein
VTSLPYTLQENEVSKPEIGHFSTLYTTAYLAHSFVVYRVEKSHVTDVVYLTHSLVVHRIEK